MSWTVLAGDFTVYDKSENRQQRLEWSGAAADTRTVKELYLALQDGFDEPTRMVAGEPMSGQTPTDYTIGIIDVYDPDPWYIDNTSVEHLEGGAIQTNLWKRTETSNTGIIKITCNNTNIVAGDIGEDITGDTDSDAGVLLDVKGTGAGSTLWVRPDDDTAANSFDNASQGLTCNTHTATQSAAPESGESGWAGVFTQGNLEAETHIYVYQDGSWLTKYKDSTADWWDTDHIDKLFLVKEVDSLIDEGYVTVLARQYAKAYAYWTVDLSALGRNAVPVTTGPDINVWSEGSVDHGYRQFTGSAGTGTFDEANWIFVGTDWASATKRGKLTQVGGTGGAPVLTYYLLGDLTDFVASDAIKEYTGTATGDATCTAGAPSNTGPASLAGLTITHANNNTFDIDEDGTNEYYSIVIDISDELVADAYPWAQYILRRGETGTSNTDGVAAEAYLGIDYILGYTAETGSVTEGSEVTGATSGASGTVVAHHATPNILTLRNSRGTFTSGEQVEIDGSNYVTNVVPSVITPVSAAPFGTFAGGVWYCAQGVVLDNVPTADTNNWNTTDDEGTARQRPLKVSITITNTRIGDYLALWRLASAGGDIDYDEYTIDATQGAAPQSTVKVDPAITADTPASGHLVLRDISTGVEYIHRYISWTGDVFTLFGAASTTMEATSDSDTIIDTGAFGSAQVGDLICNTSRANAVAYITEVTSANEVQIAPPITGQTSGDNYVLGYTADYTALGTSDYCYVPFLLVYETTGTDGAPGSESTEISYSAPIPVLFRARNARGTGYNIKPFATELSIGSGGLSQGVIRNPETIS
jgi:hypothetical protein